MITNKRQLLITILLVVTALLLALPGCAYITGESPAPPGLTTSPAAPAAAATTDRKELSVDEAHALIAANKANPNFIIIDVRTPEEYAAGHIENSVNIDYNSASFQEEIEKLDKNKTNLVYCRTGVRSTAASYTLVQSGFTSVYHINGGLVDWQAAGFPVVQ